MSLTGMGDRRLEHIVKGTRLVDNRFEITDSNPLGHGAWGLVYEGHDHALHEDVAIKFLATTEYAEEQMRHQNLTPEQAVKNGVRPRKSARRLVYTEYYPTEDGQGIIVMEKFKRTLKTILDEAEERKAYRKDILGSGLTNEEFEKYVNDIFETTKALHKLDRIHADIKPENLVEDNDEKYLLLLDFGTSTKASQYFSAQARDHKGHPHIRAPSQFENHAFPSPMTDNFSIASVAYKILTGKFIFQEELDELQKSGDTKAADHFMHKFTHEYDHRRRIIEQKLKPVPEELHDYFKGAMCEYHESAAGAQKIFQEGMAQYNAKLKKQKVRKERIEKVKEATGAFLLGAAAMGVVAVLAPFAYLAPNSLYKNRAETEALISYHKAEDTKIMFRWEQNYKKASPILPAAETKHEHGDRDVHSIAHIMTDTYYQTAEELGYDLDRVDFKIRAANLTHERGQGSSNDRDAFETVMTHAVGGFIRDDVADLENVLTVAHLGYASWTMAVQDANSADFTKYQPFLRKQKHKPGSDDEWIISPEDQRFIQQWAYNMKQTMPRRVLINIR